MADWMDRKWVGMKVAQKVGLWVVSMVDQKVAQMVVLMVALSEQWKVEQLAAKKVARLVVKTAARMAG